MKRVLIFKIVLVSILFSEMAIANNSIFHKKEDTSNLINELPVIKASGNQIYCLQTKINIVTAISIADTDDSTTEAVYIQISTGYNQSQDLLFLTGNHPNINATWDSTSGKLKLSSPITGLKTPYTEFVAAIKDVMYTNSSKKPTGVTRTFSISLDKANYLPSNQHFYEYVDEAGLNWGTAKLAAEKRVYFGLKGYLATILSADEQQLIGEQLSGVGWLGGSDWRREGEWRWETGPEAGVMFYYNLESTPTLGLYISNPRSSGYTPNFQFWNRSAKKWYDGIQYFEPNNLPSPDGFFDEDYLHISAPGVGLKGSWNDLYFDATLESKGYIVEYGGMPGDPSIQIATSTSITIPQITQIIPGSRCGNGSVILEADSNLGLIHWYNDETGGIAIETGKSFTTPDLSKPTTYYIETVFNACAKTASRTPIIATIYNIPDIIPVKTKYTLCGPGRITLEAKTSEGTLYWYEDPTGNSLIAVGTSLTRDLTSNTTFYIEAVNNNCTTGVRLPIDVVIYDLPIIEDQEVVLCKDSKVIIDAKLSGMTYLWSTGETSQTIEVTKPAIYKVDITRPPPESCTVTETITVIEHPIPDIQSVIVEENTVTIKVTKPEKFYEYSIDGISYQSSSVFLNAPSGLQTAFVREINFCSLDTKTFIVLIAPKFFTPNDDSYNDVWEIKGLVNYPQAQVVIFDRYGKLILVLNATKSSWDGMLNKQLLPADDYWYTLKIDALSPVKTGHFSLKR